MSSYLAIAKTVLRSARRPLTPREIMNEAFRRGLMPSHLHGRTQHKTLQARLSEDILNLRDESIFFRTQPGRFFLREFIADESLPISHRIPIIARRRARELPKSNALAIASSAIDSPQNGPIPNGIEKLESWLANSQYYYVLSVGNRAKADILVWSYVVVVKDGKVLSYRQGRYREGRDPFSERRSIGFYSLVVNTDATLFDQVDRGIVGSGVRAVGADLDLPKEMLAPVSCIASMDGLVYSEEQETRDLLAVIRFKCPDWYEPLNRRLSINDLHWLDVSVAPNHTDDFDPWSRKVLEHIRSNSV